MSTTTALCSRLGQQLRRARHLAGLTQADAAQMAGITRQRWSQLENGSFDSVRKLSAAATAIGADLTMSIEIPD